jgi:hypothetical protein
MRASGFAEPLRLQYHNLAGLLACLGEGDSKTHPYIWSYTGISIQTSSVRYLQYHTAHGLNALFDDDVTVITRSLD